MQVRKHLYQYWLGLIRNRHNRAKENASTICKRLRLQTLEAELNEQLDALERTAQWCSALHRKMDAAMNRN